MNIRVAATRQERMRGLRGLDRLPPGEALLFTACRSVHTFGMRFPIQVAFLAADGRAFQVIPMAPNRVCLPRIGARHVLETAIETPIPEWVPIPQGIGSGYT